MVLPCVHCASCEKKQMPSVRDVRTVQCRVTQTRKNMLEMTVQMTSMKSSLFMRLYCVTSRNFYAFAIRRRRRWLRHFLAGCPSASSVRWFLCSSGHILLPRCLMNGLSTLYETYRAYSLAPADDLVKFWR